MSRRKRRIHRGKTEGVSPKVPWQAVVTLLVWALAYFGIDLPPEVALLVGVGAGAGAGVAARPGTVVGYVP